MKKIRRMNTTSSTARGVERAREDPTVAGIGHPDNADGDLMSTDDKYWRSLRMTPTIDFLPLPQRQYRHYANLGDPDDPWDRHYHEFEPRQFDWLLEKAGVDPSTGARPLRRAVERRRDVIYVRPVWRLVMMVIRAIPERIFKKTSL